jgi:hypothetical protein
LGVKGILIKAAELGYITEVRYGMPECFCPEELGGAGYFEPVTTELSDWSPTQEHFPIPKRKGAVERSTIRCLRTASATEWTIRSRLGGPTREISRGSEALARGRGELVVEPHWRKAADLAPCS